MTYKPTPTDAEIDAMVAAYLGDCGPQATRVYSYTRAALAKWGQPAQAASSAVLKAIREANMQLVRTGDDAFMLVPYKAAKAQAAEPVTCDCKNPYSHDECTQQVGCQIAKKLSRKTPQPVAREPLTDEQIRAMLNKHPPEDVCGWSYRIGIEDAGRHHGIKGGRHGTE